MAFNNLNIRRATIEDIKQLVELSTQLGYQNNYQELCDRFNQLSSSSDHKLLVVEVEVEKKIIAFVHLKKNQSFFAIESLEVAGLIVNKNYRNLGVGRLLMQKAEDVAKEWGLTEVRLTSNIKRTETHQFYKNLGYLQPKTSHFFIKKLKE